MSTAMGTLYDLLGALPDDDAEGLRTAFRKAAKATHPDLNPDNPEAALRFRQLVRAHDILSDEEQRAAYNQLLAIATRQLPSKSRRVYEKLHRFASSTIAATIISGVLIAGYALLGNVSPAPATTETRKTTAPELAELAAAAGVITPAANARNILFGGPDPMASFAMNDGKSYRERDIFEDRGGDRDSALTGFDLVIRGDPRFAAAYLDRAILFYRTRHFSHAFADMNRAKRVAPSKPARTLASMRKTSRPKDHPVPAPVQVSVPVRQERMIAAITP